MTKRKSQTALTSPRETRRRPRVFYVSLRPEDQRVVACKDMDKDLFVGPDSEGNSAREAREAQAKMICGTCPLIAECLTWAVTNYEVGVWGGTNDDERRAIRTGRGSFKSRGEPTTQQINRLARERRAWDLWASGVSKPAIARILSVTTGTINEYIKSQRLVRDHETDQRAVKPAADQETSTGGGSQDPQRPETPLLKDGS